MEIDDIAIRKLSLLVAAIGIISVFVIGNSIQPLKVKIKDISEKDVGKRIIFEGRVINSFQKKNALMFELFDGKKISAVKFSPSAEDKLWLMKKTMVRVIGKIEKYKGRLEVVVDSIEKAG